MRVLVVEDHDLVASGLAMGLEAEGHEVRASNGSPEDVAKAAEDGVDVVLLDLNLGDMGSGLDLMDHFDSVPVLVLTGETETAALAEAYDAGVAAVLDKSIEFPKLLRQLDAVVEGSTVEFDQRRHEIMGRRRTEEAERARRLAPFQALTPREEAVLQMLMDGMQAAEIADASFVSISTVRSQIRSILAKLGVSSQLTAVSMAMKAGWSRSS